MLNESNKRPRGGQLNNKNAVKAPQEKKQKKLVSAWIEPEVHTALKALAKRNQNTPSRQVALLLSQALLPSSETQNHPGEER